MDLRRRVLGQQEGISIVMVPDRGFEEDGEGEHVVKLVMVLKDQCGLASSGDLEQCAKIFSKGSCA